jgi:DNA-binding protein H-NS
MAKSLIRIMNQIERLTKEAEVIQSSVVDRIKKDIAHYGLTVAHLFGADSSGSSAAKPGRAKGPRAAKAAGAAKPKGTPKFADGQGNTWGGMGKRPGWVREALEAGQSLDDFLIAKPAKAAKAAKAAAPAKKTRGAGAKRGKAAIAPAAPAKKTRKTAAAKPAGKRTPNGVAQRAAKPKAKAGGKGVPSAGAVFNSDNVAG